ncbi:MAG: Extracellular ligand-binding receptor [Candidatus Magasanikbacteria bacterium GW2011_GWE2_42_7]|uniref:Extracellular ligand-binding receptor n=1 Tax=Candidatus Magasanikbacteria bacterium GW2011_GWE2_42_7 TaxID=1619052 RepID=A0A0G1BAC9_9BACT|nr:MAG: Extracellular ligand-binding receptor [Candidatus Magasanikbacteria bacterium GW2011_GWE2_42_7]
MNQSTKWIVGVIVVVAVVAVGYFVSKGPSEPVSTEPIKIGFIGPLTGDAATYGVDEKNATALAVEEINNAGGIKGRSLEVIYEDGKCSGKDAATAAQKLINIDGVKIILGGACSGETLSIAPIAEQNKIIIFSAFSSSPDITKAGDYIFRNSPSDLDVAKGYAQFIVSRGGYKNIAIISENTDYAGGVKKVFNEEIARLGGKIVADEVFKQEERDFRTNIAIIKSSNADAIFINPQSGVTGGLALKQIKELGVTTPVFSVFTFGGKDALEAAGSATEGLIYFDIIGLATGKGKAFADKFTSRFGKIGGNDYDTGARYDSVYIITDALKKCAENTECIKNYLYGMDWYDGTIGRYKFDSNGDVLGIEPLTPKIIKDGKAELYK